MTAHIEIPASFPDPGAVAGKRVVITGASRGLGALLAHAFSHAGASVALVARIEKDLKAVAEGLWPPGGGADSLLTQATKIVMPSAFSPMQ